MKLFIASFFLSGFLFCTHLMAADNCCTIIFKDLQTGMVTPRDIASGRTFEFHVTNQQLLAQLDPGITFGRTSVTGLSVPPGQLEPAWVDICCVFAPPIDAIDVRPDSMNPMDLKRGVDIGTSKVPNPDDWTPEHSAVDIGTSRVPLPDDWTPSHSLAPGVTLQILSLKRLGTRVVKLEFSVTNGTGDRQNVVHLGVGTHRMGTYFELSALSLIDYDGGMKYRIVTDADGNCACTRGQPNLLARLEPGKSRVYWAHFTAPSTDVNTITLEIPGFKSIDGVPIQP